MDEAERAGALATELANLRLHIEQAAQAQPEYLRLEKACHVLRLNLAATGGQCLLMPHEDCLAAIYGKNGVERFWSVYLNKTASLPAFLRTMALLNSSTGQQDQVNGLALRSALRCAYDMEETWLIRTASFGDAGQRIVPRKAAEWLLNNPLFCHLVPPSLAVVLRPSEAPVSPDPEPPPLPPFDEIGAQGILTGMKVGRALDHRPSREEAQTILSRHYAHVPRDKAQKVVLVVWKAGRRGPRNPRNHAQKIK